MGSYVGGTLSAAELGNILCWGSKCTQRSGWDITGLVNIACFDPAPVASAIKLRV